MKRLLRDASAISGIEYDISSYADIVDAIHVIQTEMGITGTTANEASSTISGSIGTMKAAWSNFLTGMADDNQDFDVLLGNLVNSIVTVIGNIIPRIKTLLPRLIQGLNQLIKALIPEIPGIVTAVLPGIIEGAVALMGGLIDALPALIESLMTAIQESTDGALGDIVDSVLSIVPQVMTAFQELLPIAGQIIGLVSQIFPILAPIINQLLPVLVDLANMLLPPLVQIISTLLPPLLKLLTPILSLLTPLIQLLQPILDLIVGILAPIATLISDLLTPLIEVITAVINVALKPLQFMFELVSSHIKDTVCAAIELVMNNFNMLRENFTEIISFIKNIFTGDWEAAWQNIKNIFANTAEGIGNAFKAPINYIIDLINNFIEGLNKIEVPDWVPAVGGKGINIPLIPKLEKGGILEKGQVGLLEGNGAEAVVPLDQNEKWIRSVSQDMAMQGIGGGMDYDRLFEVIVMAIRELLPELQNTQRIEADENGIFRVVRDKAREYTEKTGNSFVFG